MGPEIDERFEYRHPGMKSGPAPGLPGLEVGIIYTLRAIRGLGETYFVKLREEETDKELPLEYNLEILEPVY